ncbi:MAG: YkgJ family cysteine cluster protein [Candidatus Delongbacteria bacterium]|nr:YkgJ family cysteine cluster protein [Candidatus Delongbacteria bacterium]
MGKDNCKGCTQCCKLFLVCLNETEYESCYYDSIVTGYEHLSTFKEVEENGLNILKKKDDGSCVYLKDNKCAIYSKRPQVCRDFFCGSEKKELQKNIEEIEKQWTMVN